MNWQKCIADIDLIMQRNYTPGRGGKKIKKIVLHHNAGNLSVEGCYNTWQTRPASAHYQVEKGGRVGQLVWDSDTAWHAGNFEIQGWWSDNEDSLSIEHANSTYAPHWDISEETLDTGAHLVAALCHLYGLGRPEWHKNLFEHSYFSATACPGALAGGKRDQYVQRAQKWYDEMADIITPTEPSNPPAPPVVPGKTVAQLAQEVIIGAWGNGPTRVDRLIAAGYDAVAVQAEVNRVLLGHADPGPGQYNITQLADQVIQGEWGNDPVRSLRLQQAGYDAVAVQAEVNRILLGTSTPTPTGYSLADLADQVIRGEWGNGQDRVHRLQQAGYDYQSVQAEVNRRLA